MTDENNDKLMAQFIEKSAPKLLEALTEQFDKRVQDKVDDTLKGFKSHADRLLDEVKDTKRERAEAAEKFEQFASLVKQNPTSPKSVNEALSGGERVRLTRSQARDTALYRRAKELCAERGQTHPEIVNDPE